MDTFSFLMSMAVAIQEAFQAVEIAGFPAGVFDRMAEYLDVLTRWNARLNLTAIRDPSKMIRRHLVECGFLAQCVSKEVKTLMDYGSGAGLPGVVVAICRPEIHVTLAEAHGKKASFLREVIRNLDLKCEIYEGRVEAMPSQRTFDAVALRAVEKMDLAIPVAAERVTKCLMLMTTETLAAAYRVQFADVAWGGDLRIPGSDHGVIAIGVPRGTSNLSVPRGTG